MKKVLAFVLVLAMVLGSVAMVFATDYSDDAAITNKEAVAVLSAAGILEGDANGFRPADGLTRAEGATIVARMLLGKADAAKLTTVVGPFNDVPATHWAAGYISYAVSQGIIDGYGNGNFGPEDPLTVAQFGKMMLTALGYKSENEGFTGANWETNVGSVMVKAGLTDGVTLSGSNACVREVAAQVALNTIKAELVTYDGTPTTVSAGNVTVTTGQSAAKKDAWQSGDKDNTYNGELKATSAVRFMNRYQKKIAYSTAVTDDFGRPGEHKWSYDGKNVYTKGNASDLAAKYTTKQTEKTIYALLNDKDVKGNEYTYSLTVNTAKAYVPTITAAGIGGLATVDANAQIRRNNTADFLKAYVGNGTQIEVYVNSSNKRVDIVVYDYYLVKATADYSTSKESVNVELQSSAGALTINKIAKEDVKAVTSVKEDDYLIITATATGAATKVESIALAQKVTGTVTSYTQDSDITIDGTTYKKSVTFKGTAFTGLAANSELTAIVDPNNFVMKTVDEVSKNQYVYIYKAATDGTLETEHKAIAYFVDGTRQIITLDDTASWNLVSGGAVGWYNYSVKSNGNYKIATITGKGAEVGATNVAGISAGSITYAPGKAKATNNTTFIVKKADKNAATVYTGYKTVPGSNVAATVAAVLKDDYANFVFIEAGNVIGASTSDYLIIYDTGAFSTKVDGDTTYKTYGKAVLNGTPGTVEMDESVTGVAAGTIALYKDLTYNADGRVESGAPVAGIENTVSGLGNVGTTTRGAVAYSNGVLTITGAAVYGIADNAKAYVYDKDTLEEVSFSNVKNTLGDGAEVYVVFVKFVDTSANKPIIESVYFIQQ